jgi:porphobilinogen synthase
MSFPQHRPRRLRRTERLRALVRETTLGPGQLIQPLFTVAGEKGREPIPSMPGCERLTADLIGEQARRYQDLGLGGIILFGIPQTKDATGSGAWAEDGVVPRAIRAAKKAAPDLLVWADVCLCEYTDHGHCGIVENDEVKNDETLPLLARAALAYAHAGADVIAPSDMMDGRVGAIRMTLDETGFSHIPICSYAAKYASAFYGPFRDAAGSTPRTGDRRGYQMDPANAREALREVALDIDEGADMVMVKPALAYLDVIRAVKDTFPVPVAAYNVSGEFSMVRAAAERGWIDGNAVAREMLLSMRRAGADVILSYFAAEIAAGGIA